jgi:hypothetical protein
VLGVQVVATACRLFDPGGFGVSGDGDAAWIGPNSLHHVREDFPRTTYP